IEVHDGIERRRRVALPVKSKSLRARSSRLTLMHNDNLVQQCRQPRQKALREFLWRRCRFRATTLKMHGHDVVKIPVRQIPSCSLVAVAQLEVQLLTRAIAVDEE